LAENQQAGSIKILHDVVVHGKTLPAGKYLVHWTTQSSEANVEFTQRQGAVLATQGTFVDRGTVYHQNMYVTDVGADGTQSLLEVRFAGSSKVLTFN
jgi:hypothetical protein